MEDLESGNIKYILVENFLLNLKIEFEGENNNLVKVTELKKVEQRGKTIEEFVQKFKKTARESGFKRRVLVEEFKQRMNRMIRRKLMEAKQPSRSIEQWYERATNLNRHWRESRRKKARLNSRRKGGENTQEQRQRVGDRGENERKGWGQRILPLLI